ncbi:sodium:proton antiporter [Bacteroidia bacterium]|nr:sodium:proton antiporter [Bacteroidia bacterium]GHV38909.1 sodium:proton antiporter [Bacteroidia bacterium]
MEHLPRFVNDLALILITTGIATIICKWLKQPVVLGYIIAGLLISPHITFFPSITDLESVHTWSEIGIIFFLFALGLEFSFKKLMDVGGTASIATLFNMACMVTVGYTIGKLLGWSHMDSLFLGGMLSMSSTTIVIKTFNDMSLQKTRFAGIAFGMLIVEDLAAILMLVLLSTVAVSKHFEGTQLIYEIFKLTFFIVIWFVGGIYLIPTFLKKLKKHLNDETLLIISVGLCLGMVLFATYVGFSAALGAFIMGSILSETLEGKHIEHMMLPLKNLFGAIFFVSVGMMIEVKVIAEYGVYIALFTCVILIGRPLFSTIGILLSGQGLKVAVKAACSLALVGEFSFIIATLGTSLGVISKALYPIIVAVAVITTFISPYMLKMSDPFADWIIKRIPPKWERLIEGYASSAYNTVTEEKAWSALLKKVFTFVAVYLMISIAVIQLFKLFINPFIIEHIPGVWGKVLAAALTLTCMAPLLRAIIMKKNRSDEFRKLWNKQFTNRVALVILIIFRVALCFFAVIFELHILFPSSSITAIIIAIVYLAAIVFIKGVKIQSRRIEKRFIDNFNSKEKNAAISSAVAKGLLSKNIHIEEIEVSPGSPSVGKTLSELNYRQTTGVNIITIIRGNRRINIPDGKACLYPYDRIIICGSDDEIMRFVESVENLDNGEPAMSDAVQHHISLSQYPIGEGSVMIDKSIARLSIREQTECMVIGIDRGNESITNFSAGFVFHESDVVWIAGETDKLALFETNINKLFN